MEVPTIYLAEALLLTEIISLLDQLLMMLELKATAVQVMFILELELLGLNRQGCSEVVHRVPAKSVSRLELVVILS